MRKINLKKYTKTWISICLVVCFSAIFIFCARKFDEQFKVSDLQNACRWTDSIYVTVDNGEAYISNNAPLSQWPLGHDALVYESMGRLDIILYSEKISWSNCLEKLFQKDQKKICFGCSIIHWISPMTYERNLIAEPLINTSGKKRGK